MGCDAGLITDVVDTSCQRLEALVTQNPEEFSTYRLVPVVPFLKTNNSRGTRHTVHTSLINRLDNRSRLSVEKWI